MKKKTTNMKKIFTGWYKETHLGDLKIEGTDIQEMNQQAYEEFLEMAEDQGYTDLDDNIHIDYIDDKETA